MKKNLLTLIIMAAVTIMASCTKAPVEDPNEGNDPSTGCNKKGKFENVVCGWGVYQNYWIRLDDGTLLQPCLSDAALINQDDIYDGMPVELGYTGLKNSSGCESPICCLAYPGDHEVVRITCIKALKQRCPGDGSSECTTQGILRDWHNKLDGCGWIIETNDGERLEVLDAQIDNNQFSDNTPVVFGYKVAYRGSICMSGTPVDLTCIRVANTVN